MEDKNALQRATLNTEGYAYVLQSQQNLLEAVGRGEEAQALHWFHIWVPKDSMFPALERIPDNLLAVRRAQGCMLLSLLLHAGFLWGCSVAGLWVVFERYTGRLILMQDWQEFEPLMEAAIADMCRLARAEEEALPGGRLSAVCRYINTHLGEPLTLERLAGQAGVSPGYLNVLFRQELGCTAYDYVQRRRLFTAKLLLADPEYPVSSIAAELAFSSPSHFARFFAAHEGCTPTRFRRQSVEHSTALRLWRTSVGEGPEDFCETTSKGENRR